MRAHILVRLRTELEADALQAELCGGRHGLAAQIPAAGSAVEDADGRKVRQQFSQQFDLLVMELPGEASKAGDVAAGAGWSAASVESPTQTTSGA